MTSSKPKAQQPLALYYGREALAKLSEYERVILQAGYAQREQLDLLRSQGVETFAYVSLGEDFTKDQRWCRAELNAAWQTAYVRLIPAWQKHIYALAEEALELGFSGLFLDTIDMVDLYPEERPAMLELIGKLHNLAAGKPLLANRGFSLLPELAELVSGVIFESFSSRWTANGSYEPLTAQELAWTARQARELRKLGLEVYALDYAEDAELAEFARQRAERYGFASVVSNRDLTKLG
jgi:hypothetical protein